MTGMLNIISDRGFFRWGIVLIGVTEIVSGVLLATSGDMAFLG